VEAVGGTRELARLANVQNMLFSYWRKHKRTPSLTYLLEVGYVLNRSPLQLMTVEPARLQASLHAQLVCRTPPQFKRPLPPSQGDLVAVQTYLQSVLAGQEGPRALRQVARHLGVGEKFLVGRFPHECAQITAQYQAYCAQRAKQRVRQECDEVRHVMDALQKEGAIPSIARVAERLSDPQILRRPEAKATWRSIRRQMELTEVDPEALAD
jgi:transcriptional regulator with XRE-family HTH domain